MFKAGDQVPVIPSSEVVGKGLKVAPAQIGATAVNVGCVAVVTVIVRFQFTAHCPTPAVKT